WGAWNGWSGRSWAGSGAGNGSALPAAKPVRSAPIRCGVRTDAWKRYRAVTRLCSNRGKRLPYGRQPRAATVRPRGARDHDEALRAQVRHGRWRDEGRRRKLLLPALLQGSRAPQHIPRRLDLSPGGVDLA